MGGISTTKTSGDPYLAVNALMEWTSGVASKPWSDFAPYTYGIDVTVTPPFSATYPVGLAHIEDETLGLEVALANSWQITTPIGVRYAETVYDFVNWNHHTHETLNISASSPAEVQRTSTELVGFVGESWSQVEVNSLVGLGLAPAWVRSTHFYQSFAVGLGVAAVKALTYQSNSGEGFSFHAFSPSGAKAVLFDLQFVSNPYTLAGFRAVAQNIAPIGYNTSRELIPGDYTWEKAVVGIQIQAPPAGGRVGFTGADFYVDVPDVIDRGRVSIPAEETTVTYTKQFFTIPTPEVSFVQGLTRAFPEITGTSLTGFTVLLRSMADPDILVAGDISYTVAGY